LRSPLEFASVYVYSKRGESEQAIQARRIRDRLKQGFPDALAGAARRIESLQAPGGPLAGWFGADAILVPAPGSAPLVAGGLWVPERFCIELLKHGVGGSVEPLIRRTAAVPKSAYSASGSRPSVERHLASLDVERRILPPGPIVVVDDVITKGRTLLGSQRSSHRPIRIGRSAHSPRFGIADTSPTLKIGSNRALERSCGRATTPCASPEGRDAPAHRLQRPSRRSPGSTARSIHPRSRGDNSAAAAITF
jgi:hypothetical protein